jgi:hypothetical protein
VYALTGYLLQPVTEHRAVGFDKDVVPHLDDVVGSAARTPAWLPGVRAAADPADHAGGHWAD